MQRKRLVVLTGAGISAESGLRTFRDSDGLWEGYSIEEVASPEGWARNPEQVLQFYNMRRQQVAAAVPNKAHRVLAELETLVDVQIITQNIDDLHERAGSSSVLHLHGEIFLARSVRDLFKTYPIAGDIHLGDLAEDGGQLRPHIVWFGESVPMIEPAASLVARADFFAVIGTSLVVYPAAGLVHYVPAFTPICILDRKLPAHSLERVFEIEQPATEGIDQLRTWLETQIRSRDD